MSKYSAGTCEVPRSPDVLALIVQSGTFILFPSQQGHALHEKQPDTEGQAEGFKLHPLASRFQEWNLGQTHRRISLSNYTPLKTHIAGWLEDMQFPFWKAGPIFTTFVSWSTVIPAVFPPKTRPGCQMDSMQLRHHRLQKNSKVRIKALVATNTASHPGQQERKKKQLCVWTATRYHHTTLKTDIKQTKNGCFYSCCVFSRKLCLGPKPSRHRVSACNSPWIWNSIIYSWHWSIDRGKAQKKNFQSPFARSSGSFETSKSNKVLYVRCLVSCSIPKSRLWNWSIQNI